MCQRGAQQLLSCYTFNLFVILCFRLELQWPSDVNREVTIFCIGVYSFNHETFQSADWFFNLMCLSVIWPSFTDGGCQLIGRIRKIPSFYGQDGAAFLSSGPTGRVLAILVPVDAQNMGSSPENGTVRQSFRQKAA